MSETNHTCIVCGTENVRGEPQELVEEPDPEAGVFHLHHCCICGVITIEDDQDERPITEDDIAKFDGVIYMRICQQLSLKWGNVATNLAMMLMEKAEQAPGGTDG